MSLNQIIASMGLATAPAPSAWSMGSKHILRDGVIVFTGDAYEVMAWVRATK